MDTYEELNQSAHAIQLEIFGGFHTNQESGTPSDTKTLIMLGPREPGFWSYFTEQPEYKSGKSNPLDRWSKRVIDGLADQFSALPLYPFGGPPHHPFMTWAIKTKRSWYSPVQFLVHDKAGLMVSYRGVLCFNYHITLPEHPKQSPCDDCLEKPCKTACPSRVLTPRHYDANGCRNYITTPEGSDCMNNGCMVRRICPISQRYDRNPLQSGFHQTAFVKNR